MSHPVVDQTIRLAFTPCNLGGRRAWLVCGICGRRCTALYAPDGDAMFDCRVCLGMAYASTHEGKVERLERRLKVLHDTLYERDENGDEVPRRWLHGSKIARVVPEYRRTAATLRAIAEERSRRDLRALGAAPEVVEAIIRGEIEPQFVSVP